MGRKESNQTNKTKSYTCKKFDIFNNREECSTVKSLLQAWASIRIITVHRDGVGPLFEAASARKSSSNLSVGSSY